MYVRLYERLKIYNSNVFDVCDLDEKKGKWTARGNLSSLMVDDDELNTQTVQ